MKAILYTEYGTPEVVQIKDIEKPTPKDNEVLIRVHAAAVNYADGALLTGNPYLVRADSGFTKPKNSKLGSDVSGMIEAVGKDITQFKVGDAVYGDLSGCGRGSFAEYAVATEDAIALKPSNLTFEEAAAVPMAGVTALMGLRENGQIKAGQRVLINGASGGVGTYAVQIAKSFDTEVTAVCSTSKVEMVRSLGADHVIDYKKEDFTKGAEKYDLILAANGYHFILDYKRALTSNGTYVCAGGKMKQIFQGLILGAILSKFGSQKLTSYLAIPSKERLDYMTHLIEAGHVKPVIDRCYPLAEVAEGLNYTIKGHAVGKVVITIANT